MQKSSKIILVIKFFKMKTYTQTVCLQHKIMKKIYNFYFLINNKKIVFMSQPRKINYPINKLFQMMQLKTSCWFQLTFIKLNFLTILSNRNFVLINYKKINQWNFSELTQFFTVQEFALAVAGESKETLRDESSVVRLPLQILCRTK